MKIRDDGRVVSVRHEGIRGSGGIAPLTLTEEKTPIPNEQETLWTLVSIDAKSLTLASKQTIARLSYPQPSQQTN